MAIKLDEARIRLLTIPAGNSMVLTAGKFSNLVAGSMNLYSNGIAISNPATANDVGFIRVVGTGESDTVLEIATGDDGGNSTAEKIVARQYNTSNAIVREAVLLNTNGTTSFPVSVTSPSFIGALTGNVTGNASSSSKLIMWPNGATAANTPGLYILSAGGATSGDTIDYNVDTPNTYSEAVCYGTILRIKYNNSSVYYTDIYSDTNNSALLYKTVTNGSSNGWVRILDSKNYTNWCDGRYINTSGDTLTGALNFKNGTWNNVGDDAAMGDCNQAGMFGIKGLNGATGIYFTPYSGSTAQKISINGAGIMTITGTVASTFSGNLTGTASRATADASGNVITSKYVAVDTTQTISGAKTFTAATRINNQLTINTSLQDHNTPTTQCLVLNSTGLTDTITEVTDKNAPGIGFHIGNVTWASLVLSLGGFKFINSNATGYADVTANKFIGALQGNANTATVLQTARTLTIGNTGKSFNGGSNVAWTIREIGAIPHFIKTSATDADTLTVTGYYSMKSGGDTNVPSTGHSMIFVDYDVGTPFQIYMHDTTNTIYKRYKNNTAGTWNAWSSTLGNSISGNAATASAFNSARTISLSGAVTGSVSSNGASGWSITTAIAEKAISPTNFTTTFRTQTKGDTSYSQPYLSVIRNDNTDSWGYMPIYGSGIAFGRYDTHTYLYTNYSSAQAYIGGGSGNSLHWIKRIAFTDGTGASGTWGISISGNAATASMWQTARTLTIGNKGQSVNGSGNVSWTLHDILYSGGISSTTSWNITDPGAYYVAPVDNSTAYSGSGNPETNTLSAGTFYRYGQLIVSRANTGGLAQFYITHVDSADSGSYGIRFRTGWNNSYNSHWRILLDNINYTNWCDGRYLNTAGDTLTGALNFKNSTWNLVGDDAYFGDNDTAGSFAIKGANGNTNLKMVTYGGTSYGTITWNGSSFTLSNSVVIGSGSHYYMTYNGGAYYVLHNHNNGNVSLNAANGGLYIGYFNTGSLNFGPEAQWGYVTANSGWVFSLGMTAANVTSNGRAYMNEWIQFNAGTGLYWPNNYSLHICPNDVSTYGGARIRGDKGGYHGIICGDSSIHMNVMSSDSHQGLFNESNSRWIVYYNRPSNIMALGGSDVSAGYTVNINGSLYVGGSHGVYTTTYYSNAITTVGNAGTWTTAPGYTSAIINFGYRAHDPVSSYYYTPWLGGVDAVNGYGYGATVTAGLYHGSSYSDAGFYIGTSWDGNGNDTFFRFSRAGTLTAVKVYGAVWNDYAEYRTTTTKVNPGHVVIENNDDTLSMSTERLMPGANIVSDTFGFAIGETDDAQTPLAVSGRVLAYPLEPREEYCAGDPVCSGPNGTVSKMTREEVTMYPDRIIGTVSSVPNYDTWGTGNVKVNGRIWIKVR